MIHLQLKFSRSKYLAMGCLENIQAVINSWSDSEHQAAIQASLQNMMSNQDLPHNLCNLF